MKDLSTMVGELQRLADAAVEDRDWIQRQGFDLMASAAIEANGHGEIVCIEPYPHPFLRGIPHVIDFLEGARCWRFELLVQPRSVGRYAGRASG